MAFKRRRSRIIGGTSPGRVRRRRQNVVGSWSAGGAGGQGVVHGRGLLLAALAAAVAASRQRRQGQSGRAGRRPQSFGTSLVPNAFVGVVMVLSPDSIPVPSPYRGERIPP